MSRSLVLALVVLVGVVVAAPSATAQSYDVDASPDADFLPSGGSDDGGQFPQGTDNCSGDRHHHAHNYPLNRCAKRVNPHYTTTMGGGTSCTSRSKLCGSCYDCCDLQKTEALECHCFEDYCEAMNEDVKRTCMQSCFGHYLDGCAYQPN